MVELIMTTNTAISALNKLLDYVKSIREGAKSKTLYHKSEVHLSDIVKACSEIIEIASEILEDNAYGAESEEIQKDVDTIVKRVNQMQTFISPTTVSNIATVFESDSQLTDPVYKDCFHFLKDWYTCRFITAYQVNPRYTYKRDWVFGWIENIVIGYGKYLHNNQMKDYYDMFDEWRWKVLDAANPSMYSVPYEVYRYDIGLNESDCTVEALILWNMLCTHNLSGIIESPLGMYNRFARVSDVVDEYDKLGGDDNVLHTNS